MCFGFIEAANQAVQYDQFVNGCALMNRGSLSRDVLEVPT